MYKNCILIVDDDTMCRNLVKIFLMECNYEVITARNGKEALGVLKRKRCDLLITDMDMPGMTGIDLLKRARTISYKLKVIILSGNGGVDSYLEAMIEGAIEYLMKPVGLKKLKRTVASVISQSKSPELSVSEKRSETHG